MTFPFLFKRGVTALCAGILILLSACANMSGLEGSSEYGCKAPQGVQCDSVSGNYYNAIQNNLPSQRQRHQSDTETAAPHPRVANATSSPAAVAARVATVSQTGVDNASSASFTALPLRSQARVLRLWFKPWEDADHDLYDQGFVYVTIDNGRWLIDHAQSRIRDAYAPIRPPRTTASPSAAQPATASVKPTDPRFFAAGPNTPVPVAAPSISLPGEISRSANDVQ